MDHPSQYIERPLRDWEIVLDTVSMWDGDMHNMLMLKKYPYRSSLTAEVSSLPSPQRKEKKEKKEWAI